MERVRLDWVKGLQFVAEDYSGHAIVLDTSKEVGGGESGFKPINFLLVALGGCMGFDIVSILQKKKADLKGFTVELEGERAEEHPKRFTKINVRFKYRGNVPPPDFNRAFELSRDKYCSILATLKNPPQIEFNCEEIWCNGSMQIAECKMKNAK